jgi:response regulator RpfG family c-di-GMP phosphodiesterase
MTDKVKILYVDDEEINLELFKYNFMEKYEVLTCCCGSNGLECLKKNKDVKIVISDMRMPNMNGLEFIQKAKELYNDKKFYILTGFDITPEIQNALDTNLILGYFRKPFNIKQIEKAIDKAINPKN